MSFVKQLAVGQVGESAISKWLQSEGFTVLPAYEIEQQHFKGPRLFTAELDLIAPDMLVFNARKVLWVEAKTKSAFTWHRISQTWQTGIDRRHWLDYVRVDQQTPWRVWVLFLHRAGVLAKDTPIGMTSPSGLFGNSVEILARSIHHESENHGPSGMVYWQVGTLKKIREFI